MWPERDPTVLWRRPRRLLLVQNSFDGPLPERRERLVRVWGRTGLAAIAVATVLLVSACSQTPPAPSPTPTVSPTETAPAAPALVPGGTAAENRPFFDAVNTATLAANSAADGRAFIDGLVAAGFTKTDMEVTPDTTSIDLAADSIQFSVRIGDHCLIGQNGANMGYHSELASVLDTGRCLIGTTRPIDW